MSVKWHSWITVIYLEEYTLIQVTCFKIGCEYELISLEKSKLKLKKIKKVIFNLEVEVHAKNQRFVICLFHPTFVGVKKENNTYAYISAQVTVL